MNGILKMEQEWQEKITNLKLQKKRQESAMYDQSFNTREKNAVIMHAAL